MKIDLYILFSNDYLNTPSNPGMQFVVAQRAGAAWVHRPRGRLQDDMHTFASSTVHQ